MSFVRYVRLRVPSGSARPGPAIGQSLGPLGINMMEFCKSFNEQSDKIYVKDTPLSVQLSAMSDRTFTFIIKSPPTTFMIKRAAGITKGSSVPSNTGSAVSGGAGSIDEGTVGYITPEQVYEIAKMKQTDALRWHLPLESIARSVIGTAHSMGVRVREAEEEGEKEKIEGI